MNGKARLLLLELLSNKYVTASWGITSISVTEDTVSFDVSGFNNQGRIVILITADGYSIIFENRLVMKVKLETIVEELDSFIEFGDGYLSKIADWINNKI